MSAFSQNRIRARHEAASSQISLAQSQQSGVLDLLIADLSKDAQILQLARNAASDTLDDDPKLEKEENRNILRQIKSLRKAVVNWGRIS